MNAVAESLRPYLESYAANSKPLAPALLALKESAMRRAVARGFPGARDEDWKYSSPVALEKRAFRSSATLTRFDAKDLADVAIPGLDAFRAVFVNGRFMAALSELPEGARVTSLSSAGDSLNAALAVPAEWQDDTFLNLNTALFQDGLLLELDASAHIVKPLQLLHVSVLGEIASAHHPRFLLRLAADSRIMVIERYVGLEGAQHFTNAVTQIELAERAQLVHVRLQTESAQGFHVGRVLVRQAAHSGYRSHNLQLGGLWSRLDLHTRLEATGAHAMLDGLYAVGSRQHVDNHTRVDHLAPGAVSEEIYRGVLDGHGRAVFNGKVVVAKHAVKTDAQQANHNLILSRGAEIDTKPELEIYADDVKCSHGASIGQLDEQQLFYLRSRGLDAAAARGLLIYAFADKLLSRLPHPALAAHARRLLSAAVSQISVPEQT
jgi:Fe-S cluster assembly protein SufD